MTTNSARKREIRAWAQAKGISYTEAMREIDLLDRIRKGLPDYFANLSPDTRARAQALIDSAETPEQREQYEHLLGLVAQGAHQTTSTAAEAGAGAGQGGIERTPQMRRIMRDVFRIPAPAAPLTGNTWRIKFDPDPDMRQPLDLDITDGGLIEDQDFWRGAKFQVHGFCREFEDDRDMVATWAEVAAGKKDPVGLFPIISEFAGKWNVWGERVREMTFSVRPDHADATRGSAIAGTFTSVLDEPESAPFFRFRAEEFLAALPNQTLRAMMASDLVADAEVSGSLFRAAIVRDHDRDPLVEAASNWVAAHYDADPDRWEADEPFRIYFDAADFKRWATATRLGPALFPDDH